MRNYNVVLTFCFRISDGLATGIWASSVLSNFISVTMGNDPEANTKVGIAQALQGAFLVATAIPAAWVSGRVGRSRLLKLHSLCAFSAIVVLVTALTHFVHEAERLFQVICLGLSLMGMAQASAPIVDSLFADSIATGKRAGLYTGLTVSYVLSSAIGPATAATLFTLHGDDWSTERMSRVMLVGLAMACIPASLLLMFDDTSVLGQEAEGLLKVLGEGSSRRQTADEEGGLRERLLPYGTDVEEYGDCGRSDDLQGFESQLVTPSESRVTSKTVTPAPSPAVSMPRQNPRVKIPATPTRSTFKQQQQQQQQQSLHPAPPSAPIPPASAPASPLMLLPCVQHHPHEQQQELLLQDQLLPPPVPPSLVLPCPRASSYLAQRQCTTTQQLPEPPSAPAVPPPAPPPTTPPHKLQRVRSKRRQSEAGAVSAQAGPEASTSSMTSPSSDTHSPSPRMGGLFQRSASARQSNFGAAQRAGGHAARHSSTNVARQVSFGVASRQDSSSSSQGGFTFSMPQTSSPGVEQQQNHEEVDQASAAADQAPKRDLLKLSSFAVSVEDRLSEETTPTGPSPLSGSPLGERLLESKAQDGMGGESWMGSSPRGEKDSKGLMKSLAGVERGSESLMGRLVRGEKGNESKMESQTGDERGSESLMESLARELTESSSDVSGSGAGNGHKKNGMPSLAATRSAQAHLTPPAQNTPSATEPLPVPKPGALAQQATPELEKEAPVQKATGATQPPSAPESGVPAREDSPSAPVPQVARARKTPAATQPVQATSPNACPDAPADAAAPAADSMPAQPSTPNLTSLPPSVKPTAPADAAAPAADLMPTQPSPPQIAPLLTSSSMKLTAPLAAVHTAGAAASTTKAAQPFPPSSPAAGLAAAQAGAALSRTAPPTTPASAACTTQVTAPAAFPRAAPQNAIPNVFAPSASAATATSNPAAIAQAALPPVSTNTPAISASAAAARAAAVAASHAWGSKPSLPLSRSQKVVPLVGSGEGEQGSPGYGGLLQLSQTQQGAQQQTGHQQPDQMQQVEFPQGQQDSRTPLDAQHIQQQGAQQQQTPQQAQQAAQQQKGHNALTVASEGFSCGASNKIQQLSHPHLISEQHAPSHEAIAMPGGAGAQERAIQDHSNGGGDGDHRLTATQRCQAPLWGYLSPAAIPYILALTDCCMGLASGMTIKFFPIFFRTEAKLSPSQVSLMYTAIPLALSLMALVAQREASFIGKVQTIVINRLAGILLLLFIATHTGLWTVPAAIVPLYICRTSLMNAQYPIQRSILMDYVPRASRARWASVESVTQFGWSGSAALGGFLIERFGFQFTFFVTAGMQLIGWASSLLLLPLVPRKELSVVAAQEQGR